MNASRTLVEDRLERSVLMTPASNRRMIVKASDGAADVVCIDLEDSVAPTEKVTARANVAWAFRELDFGGRLRAFRVNALATPYAYRDIIDVVEAAGQHIDLLVVPKVETAEQVVFVALLLDQIERAMARPDRIGIEAQIETALGAVNVDAIAAASTRLEALVYGPGDFAASLRMPLDVIGERDASDDDYPGHRWHYVMQRIVVAARARGLRAIDGPYAVLGDDEGLRRSCGISRALGFDGKWCIHPNQAPVVNAAFAPSAARLDWANRVMTAATAAAGRGEGALAVEGKMVDAASIRMARAIVHRARAAEALAGPECRKVGRDAG